MYGVDLYGDAAANMPVSVLANPVHFSRTSIVYDRPPPALGDRRRSRSGGSCWTVLKWN